MRRVILLLIITLCVAPMWAAAQGVKYFDGNVYDGLAQASRSGRMLMVEFYASWSYKSRWMSQNTIARSTNLTESFVIVRVDTSTPEGASMALTYAVNEYPNVLIFNHNGVVVDRIDQALSIDDFRVRLSQISVATNPTRTLQLRQIYLAANSRDSSKMNQIVGEYLAKATQTEIDASMDIFTSQSINYFSSAAFEYMIHNRAMFDSSFVEDKVRGLLLDVMTAYVSGIKPYSLDTINAITSISDNFACREIICQIAHLAKLRQAGEAFEFVQELKNILVAVDSEFQYSLVLSLDFVDPDQIDKHTKRTALRIVREFADKTPSVAKNMVLQSLVEKFL